VNYCAGGKGVFNVCAGQFSHTNELAFASTISSRLAVRRLNIIGREQVTHLGHGLYMIALMRLLQPNTKGSFR
jgi:hypothetical protein